MRFSGSGHQRFQFMADLRPNGLLPVRDHELRTGRRADAVVAEYLPVPLQLLAARLTFVVAGLPAGGPRAGPSDHLVLGQFRVPQQTHRAPPATDLVDDVPTRMMVRRPTYKGASQRLFPPVRSSRLSPAWWIGYLP